MTLAPDHILNPHLHPPSAGLPLVTAQTSCPANSTQSVELLFNNNVTTITPSQSGAISAAGSGATTDGACAVVMYTYNCTTFTIGALASNSAVGRPYTCYPPGYTFWPTNPGFFFSYGLTTTMSTTDICEWAGERWILIRFWDVLGFIQDFQARYAVRLRLHNCRHTNQPCRHTNLHGTLHW